MTFTLCSDYRVQPVIRIRKVCCTVMDAELAANVFSFIATHGYSIIIPIAILEGPVIGIVSGVVTGTGLLHPVGVFLSLLLGDFIGDTGLYLLGRWGRWDIIRRWGPSVGISEERATMFEQKFKEHDWKLLLLCKVDLSTLPTGITLLFAAGAAHVPISRFLLYTTLAGIVRIIFLMGIGFYIGRGLLAPDSNILERVAAISIVVMFTLIGIFWLTHKYKKRQL